MKKITISEIKKILPRRSKYSNKTMGGQSMIIGSSDLYGGAGILSCMGATRSGSGYIHFMSPNKKFKIFDYPDFIFHSVKQSELTDKNEFAIGIGPGLALTTKSQNILKYLIRKKFEKVIVDAGALTILSKMKKNLCRQLGFLLRTKEK